MYITVRHVDRHTWTDGETNRLMYGRPDRQMARQKQAGRQADTESKTDGRKVGRTDGLIKLRTYRPVYRRIDRLANGQTDGLADDRLTD